MITKFKLYEAINQGEPEEGDYVICKEVENYSIGPPSIKDFVENNIGQFVDFTVGLIYAYIVKYENVPDEIEENFEKNCRRFNIIEIKYWSKNRKDLEELLAIKKYNL